MKREYRAIRKFSLNGQTYSPGELVALDPEVGSIFERKGVCYPAAGEARDIAPGRRGETADFNRLD